MSRVRLFARALRLCCPACGGRPVLLGWFKLAPGCPRCGLLLERGEEGYWVGSYMFNIIAAELLVAALGIAVALATWPAPPWNGLMIGGAVLVVIAPVAFLPFSKLLFLAFDLVFRPPTEADFAASSEPAARRRA